jgi:hypothetical protein
MSTTRLFSLFTDCLSDASLILISVTHIQLRLPGDVSNALVQFFLDLVKPNSPLLSSFAPPIASGVSTHSTASHADAIRSLSYLLYHHSMHLSASLTAALIKTMILLSKDTSSPEPSAPSAAAAIPAAVPSTSSSLALLAQRQAASSVGVAAQLEVRRQAICAIGNWCVHATAELVSAHSLQVLVDVWCTPH